MEQASKTDFFGSQRWLLLLEAVALLPLSIIALKVIGVAITGAWLGGQSEPVLLVMFLTLTGGLFEIGPAMTTVTLSGAAIYVASLWMAILFPRGALTSHKPMSLVVLVGLLVGVLLTIAVMAARRDFLSAPFFWICIFIIPLGIALHHIERFRRVHVSAISVVQFRVSLGLLALLTFVVTALMNTDYLSPRPSVRDPRILDTYSDEELRAIANRVPPEHRASKYKGLVASVEKSKRISDALIEIHVGEYRYRVPMNYLTPWGDFRKQRGFSNEKLVKRLEYKGEQTFESSGFYAFLPDYRGYDRKNFLDPFHPDRIDAHWWAEEHGTTEAEARIRSRINFKMMEPIPSLSNHGLKGYRGLGVDVNKEVWTGLNRDGQMLFIQCWPKSQNPLCQVRYHHKPNRYWLSYTYKRIHLAQWREIDANINGLLTSWRTGELGNSK